MSWKHTFFLAIVAGLLAFGAAWIMTKIYATAFYVDYSSVIHTSNLLASCILGCTLMALGYKLAFRIFKQRGITWINLLYAILSYASIAGVLGFNLPLEIESPELFPGMVIPMHFFPLLALLLVYPFFNPNKPLASS